jgi:RNA polymerase sigma-70 factor (ECF subfamily)
MATPASWDAGEVFRRLGPPVLAYLRAANSTVHEDLLSDVFVSVTRGLHKFEGDEAALRRWVVTIARNRLRDEHRRTTMRRVRQASAETATQSFEPPEPFDPALVVALQTLTLEQREVVMLRFVADLSLEDVAQMTRRTVGATKALQHRAIAALAQTLATS